MALAVEVQSLNHSVQSEPNEGFNSAALSVGCDLVGQQQQSEKLGSTAHKTTFPLTPTENLRLSEVHP